MQNSKLQVKSQNFLRYKITEDGISERLVPGTPGYFYQANSYEHVEDGHTSEDGVVRKQQVEKRAKKWDTYLQSDFQPPVIFGNLESSQTVFVSWGSNKGPILEAQKLLKQSGKETAFMHFTHLYPMKRDVVAGLFKDTSKRYILIENNSQAQFGKLLLMETGIEIKEKLLKYDGRPFLPEEIVEKLT